MAKVQADRARVDMTIAIVAGALDLTVDEVGGDGRSVRAVFARQVVMYVASIGFGMSYGRVARAMARDRSTVAHHCKLIEDRRDDPEFDRWIEALERTVAAAPVIA